MFIEVLVMLIFLFSLWVLGRSFLLTLKLDDCNWLAMPVGFCLVGLLGNFLYFGLGLSVPLIQLFFLLCLVMCLPWIFRQQIPRSEWGRLAAVGLVFLWLALPLFIGGEQYGVFRGNGEDHFNYIDESLAMWAKPYSAYKDNPLAICGYHFAPHEMETSAYKFLSQDVLLHGLMYIYIRPAVGLVFAIILPHGKGDIHLLAFLYITALWSLIFASFCFAWKRLLLSLGNTKYHKSLLIVPALAYVMGFWGQYIFDINSWSEMASISLLIAFVFQYIKLLQGWVDPQKQGKSMPQYLVTLLLASGAYLFYPENTLPQAVFITGATVLWCILTRIKFRWRAYGLLILFWAGVLLISSVPNWRGTGPSFIIHQMYDGMSQMPNWKYFDTYWLGIHDNGFGNYVKPTILHGLEVLKSFHHYKLGIPPVHVFITHLVNGLHLIKSFNAYWIQIHLQSLVGYISTLSNLFLGFAGMYFLAPDYTRTPWLRDIWILLTVILAIGIVYAWAVNFFSRFKSNSTVAFFKSFYLMGILFLMFLLFRGSLWGFGKGLSYLSAYLYLIFYLGLLQTDQQHFMGKALRVITVVLIFSQIFFGVYRVWASQDPDGIGYDQSTYPSVGNAELKTNYRWALNLKEYQPSRGVGLYEVAQYNLNDAYYQEFMKQKFIYAHIPYYSNLPVRTFYHQAGIEVGHQPSMITDCKMTLIRRNNKWEAVKL